MRRPQLTHTVLVEACVVVLGLLFFAACRSGGEVAIKRVGPVEVGGKVAVNKGISVAAEVHNPNNLPLTYQWNTTGGVVRRSGESSPSGTYEAPGTPGTETITVQVLSGGKVLAEKSFQIEVVLELGSAVAVAPSPTSRPTSSPVPPASKPAMTPTAQEGRDMTNYSAKQALARLTLYLRERNEALPRAVWAAVRDKTGIYTLRNSPGLGGVVGGWAFFYEDTQGRSRAAVLNCWGEVTFPPGDQAVAGDLAKQSPRAIQLDEWVLDDTDAHMLVLSGGGVGQKDTFANARLLPAAVKGRGIRPVWAGGVWYLPVAASVILVDAQTGEIYRPVDDKGFELEPLSQTPQLSGGEWNGGFDEGSKDALISKAQYWYWWPRAYQNAPSWYTYNAPMRFTYNRPLLRSKLDEERKKPNRTSSSWMTSGIIHAVLGDWAEAVNDLSRAVQIEPQNPIYRYYRGLVFLVIRDLDKAESDFQALPPDNSDRLEAREYVAVLRTGSRPEKGAFMRNVETDVGMLPLVVWITSVPLTPN